MDWAPIVLGIIALLGSIVTAIFGYLTSRMKASQAHVDDIGHDMIRMRARVEECEQQEKECRTRLTRMMNAIRG